MTELSPTARALLDAARDGLTPSGEALRRVRGKVDAAVGGGSAATALVLKLSIVVVALGIAAGAIGLSGSYTDVVLPVLALPEAPVVIRADVQARASDDPPPPAEIEMPADRAARPQAAVTEPRLAPPEPGEKLGLAREVAIIDAAMASLGAGDADAALASVRLHREETHGAGQLAEDAAAIEIEALCRLHDRRVAAKLEAFDARWPESAQRSRLTTNCP